ncbi:MAG: JmjC domain-containing histone demethylation protein 1 [Chrysothrix sp. TS-e1954]|nr:MAG: JmjC domain-containing histone demethylation protein 1 [Chrysothrix sp. TS-e1954]
MTEYSYVSGSFDDRYVRRDIRYRTPSPPTALVEPISPLLSYSHSQPVSPSSKRKRDIDTYDDTDNDVNEYRSQKAPYARKLLGKTRGPPPVDTGSLYRAQPSPSPLDALAAAATSPLFNQGAKEDARTAEHLRNLSNAPSYSSKALGRQSKRTRSEIITYRPEISVDPRPATSYTYEGATELSKRSRYDHTDQSTDDQTGGVGQDHPHDPTALLEAELLLNFSRSFKPSSAVISESTHLKHPGVLPPPVTQSMKSTASASMAGNSAAMATALDSSVLPPAKVKTPEVKNAEMESPAKQASVDLRERAVSTSARSSGSITAPAQTSVPQTLSTERPKSHRGWPKGKPRGPRTHGSETRKPNKAVKKVGSITTSARRKRESGKVHKEHFETEQFEYWDEVKDAAQSKVTRARSEEREIDFDYYECFSSKRARAVSAGPRVTASRSAKQIMTPRVIPKWRPKNQKTKGITKPQKVATRIDKVAAQPLSICASCSMSRNTSNGYQDLWISCNGCKSWFHTTCVGIDKERTVKDIDKFHCKSCEQSHGPTTFVRKSGRAHASVDYAGLHEGKMRTATDVVEHHYIEPIKDGRLGFQAETFPRMPPELITADYFERCGGMTEPILVPAALNPQPGFQQPDIQDQHNNLRRTDSILAAPKNDLRHDNAYNDGQDKLDMVIPQGLTVRQVAELYGPEEKVEVIDVKLQEGEDKRWNMRQWADYYEAEGEKPVRNVISLEVSQSLLGKLIRRPKIVRDLDLQDSVWPLEDRNKDIFPRVQFYCLMSVADCYTDFHIDFGGSSVYYHILKGRKTFFFIPPSPKNLKKYEEWCLSPDQNSTFLGHETNECYRVDLYRGDTMLIPSGWIHAVWTPENSLVIGGNFLTRMHYGMQIQINDIEKATGVARKFRYPHFQKVLWHTLLKYLRDDPVPSTVHSLLCTGKPFSRELAVHQDYDLQSVVDVLPETFNARYYSKAELDGLPDLLRYIYRTVMISLGKVHGVTKGTQDAVLKSLPKGFGDHGTLLKTFAIWIAWKRGNETIPHWAYPEVVLADMDINISDRKLSAAEKKRIDRQAAHEAYKVSADRRPSRQSEKNGNAPPRPSSAHTEIATTTSPATLLFSPKKDSTGINTPPQFGIKVIEQLVSHPRHSPSPPFGHSPVGHSNEYGLQEPSDTGELTHQVSSTDPGVLSKSPGESLTPRAKRPKVRACIDCRLSKRRCIHDEAGRVDPVKAQQQSVPRGSHPVKRFALDDLMSPKVKRPKQESEHASLTGSPHAPIRSTTPDLNLSRVTNPTTSSHALDVPEAGITLSNAMMHSPWQTDMDENRTQVPESVLVSSTAQSLHDVPSNSLSQPVQEKTRQTQPAHDALQDNAYAQVCHDGATMGNSTTESQSDLVHINVLAAGNTDSNAQDRPASRQAESSSRTPSLHIQSNSTDSNGASNSRPSSPLTEIDESPKQAVKEEPINADEETLLSPTTKRAPRERTQVAHYINTNANGTRKPAGKVKSPSQPRSASTASSKKSSAKPAGVSKKRSASRSISQDPARSRASAVSPAKSVVEKVEEADEVEDEDEKLAKSLMEQEFGLRRRRGT